MLDIYSLPYIFFFFIFSIGIWFFLQKSWQKSIWLFGVSLVSVLIMMIVYWPLKNQFFNLFKPVIKQAYQASDNDVNSLQELSHKPFATVFISIFFIPMYIIVYFSTIWIYKKWIQKYTTVKVVKKISKNERVVNNKKRNWKTKAINISIASFTSLFLSGVGASAASVLFITSDQTSVFTDFTNGLSTIYTFSLAHDKVAMKYSSEFIKYKNKKPEIITMLRKILSLNGNKKNLISTSEKQSFKKLDIQKLRNVLSLKESTNSSLTLAIQTDKQSRWNPLLDKPYNYSAIKDLEFKFSNDEFSNLSDFLKAKKIIRFDETTFYTEWQQAKKDTNNKTTILSNKTNQLNSRKYKLEFDKESLPKRQQEKKYMDVDLTNKIAEELIRKQEMISAQNSFNNYTQNPYEPARNDYESKEVSSYQAQREYDTEYGKLSNLKQRLINIKTNLKQSNTGLSKLKNEIKSLNKSIKILNTDISNSKNKTNTQKYKNEIMQKQTTLTQKQQNLSYINSNIQSQSSQQTTTEGDIRNSKSNLQAKQASKTRLHNDFVHASNSFSPIKSKHTNLEADKNNKTNIHSNIVNAISDLRNSIGSKKHEIANIEYDIQTLSGSSTISGSIKQAEQEKAIAVTNLEASKKIEKNKEKIKSQKDIEYTKNTDDLFDDMKNSLTS